MGLWGERDGSITHGARCWPPRTSLKLTARRPSIARICHVQDERRGAREERRPRLPRSSPEDDVRSSTLRRKFRVVISFGVRSYVERVNISVSYSVASDLLSSE